MRKFLIIFCVLILNFNFAQNSKIENDSILYEYHFDNLITFSNIDGESLFANFKFIDSKDDNYTAVTKDINYLTLHDFKNNILHSFSKKIENGVANYVYTGSYKQKYFSGVRYIDVKKIGDKKYILKKITKKDSSPGLTLIVNLESTKEDLANSLYINEQLNFSLEFLKPLRRKEKNKTFIIKSYQSTYDGKTVNYYFVKNTKKVDITLKVPKKLIFDKMQHP